MLQAIMNQNVLLYGVVVFSVLGGLSQIILNSIYRRAIKDMENMNTPRGKLMKRINEKYRNYRRINDNKMNNINIFIEKAMMEYRLFGMNLHSWRRCGVAAFLICAFLGAAGYYLSGTMNMAAGIQQNYLMAITASTLLLAGIYGLTDTSYKKKYIKTSIENSYINEQMGQALRSSIEAIDKPIEKKAADKGPTLIPSAMQPRRKRGKVVQTKAQRDKQELKDNLAKLKEGISETAAATERSKERNSEILKQMDSAEQERVIREVLKEFLS